MGYGRWAGIFSIPDVSRRGSVYAPIDESGHVTKQGRFGGMLFRAVFTAAAIATVVICSPAPAHADQDGYLKMLAGDGFPMTPDNFASMLQLGYAVCATLRTSDLSEQQAVSRILRDTPDASPQKAQLVVAAAHSQLCPDVSSSH